MRVHLVGFNVNHVVPRMLRWMAERYGWSMGIQRARPDVDVNYYGSYLAHAYSNPVKTLKTGWHTHFEGYKEWKAEAWSQAAIDFDLRLITSSLYIKPLEKFGPVAKITPGIHRRFFTPQGSRPNKNRVGTAGIGSRRKGLDLLERLIENEPKIEVLIAGKKFGRPTVWRHWEDMPQFYRTLDVYLVTSTIEGVPAPPLEALACGVKVVVPNKVGIMDELPEMKGIRHYKKGDYQDMVRAIKLVLTDKASQEELRAITEKYSVGAWCKSNRMAMEKML